MKLAIVGTGYVGLVTGTCLAEMGNEVTCVDIDKKKIKALQDGIIPIYEPQLEEMVKNNLEAGRLTFTSDMKTTAENHNVIFIAVGTPPDENGRADLKYVYDVAREIGQNITKPTIVVNKSTVPVGTGDEVRKIILSELKKRGLNISFDVASNPEFLKEGAAIQDFMRPDRIVIGTGSTETLEKLSELYSPFVKNGFRIVDMDVRSSEMTKYAANCMLATKISFINEMSRLAEKLGADISAVRQGIGADKRIGYHFIHPGLGYGGSCFPKDVSALIQTADDNGIEMTLMKSVEETNTRQRQFFIDKILGHFQGNLSGKKVALWGLAFKPETDDIREAPSLDIIKILIERGAHISAYDPVACENTQKHFGANPAISYSDKAYDALKDADALVLATEWKVFRSPNFEMMKSLMKAPVIFDGRNQYEPQALNKLGFDYHAIGRLTKPKSK